MYEYIKHNGHAVPTVFSTYFVLMPDIDHTVTNHEFKLKLLWTTMPHVKLNNLFGYLRVGQEKSQSWVRGWVPTRPMLGFQKYWMTNCDTKCSENWWWFGSGSIHVNSTRLTLLYLRSIHYELCISIHGSTVMPPLGQNNNGWMMSWHFLLVNMKSFTKSCWLLHNSQK